MADIPTPSNNSSSHTTPTQAQALTPAPRAMPVREDCWSEEATATLVEAWGQRYLDLNRGNLRQKQWQEVADTVNSRHAHNLKARRTDVQCKNRIDTLKKKYKIEKSRVLESNSVFVSSWLFFNELDRLIGNSVSALKKPNPSPTPSLTPVSATLCYSIMNTTNNNYGNVSGSGSGSGSGNGGVNVNTPVLAQKRPLGAEDFRRNYAAVAAAAAREEEESEEDEDGDEEEVERESEGDGEEEEGEDGIRKLAKVIEKFGEVYARVEGEKQKQLIELEKQRMEFAKEMECQRMQMLVEMQVQLEKFKRAKRSHSDGL